MSGSGKPGNQRRNQRRKKPPLRTSPTKGKSKLSPLSPPLKSLVTTGNRKQTPVPRFPSARREFLKVWFLSLASLASILSIAVYAYDTRPLLDIQPQSDRFPGNDGTIPLQFINKGWWTLYDIHPIFHINYIHLDGGALAKGQDLIGSPIEKISPRDEETEMWPYFIAGQSYDYGSIRISVTYKAWLWWWNHRQIFDYQFQRDRDGKLTWFRNLQVPIDTIKPYQ